MLASVWGLEHYSEGLSGFLPELAETGVVDEALHLLRDQCLAASHSYLPWQLALRGFFAWLFSEVRYPMPR